MKHLILIGKIFYILFCIALTLILLFFCFITIFGIAISFKLVLYVLFLLFAIIIFWSLLFSKIKVVFKVLIFAVLFPLTIFIFLFAKPMGFVYIDSCVDTEICPEGYIKRNNKGNIFVISKKTCEKYGYKWYEEDKSCNLRDGN